MTLVGRTAVITGGGRGVGAAVAERLAGTGAAVLLHVPELADSAPNAAVLASAKHLLDTYLGKPLIPKAAAPAQVLALPSPAAEDLPMAAASD